MELQTPIKKLLLYFDDSGSRDPNHDADYREDGMDWFALGGILLEEEAVKEVVGSHKKFCEDWGITYPLHSSRIRGARGEFSWLWKPEDREVFFPALENYLLAQPVICLACVINRPGYVARYREAHKERMWLLCKTAFTILVERAAKYADSKGRKLEVYFERTGKKEDRNIVAYLRELKKTGNPFNVDNSGGYSPLKADDFSRIVLGEPARKTKKVPMIQLADLVLYPIAKWGYDQCYKPYTALKEADKLIDCLLSEAEIPICGIKYSCFDGAKIKAHRSEP